MGTPPGWTCYAYGYCFFYYCFFYFPSSSLSSENCFATYCYYCCLVAGAGALVTFLVSFLIAYFLAPGAIIFKSISSSEYAS